MGERTLVMGVLNVTPDSFTDGGRFLHPDQAYARALELEEQGADVIDLGGESTRPESKRVSAEEEWQRLAPVLKRLRGKLGIPVSIDTYKAETAARALEYDVEIINDPSGLTFDSELAKVVMEANAGLILNHMRGTPESWGGLGPMPDPMGTVLKDLDATASRARRAGVEKNRIMVDPGLGFGKRKEQNSDILAQLGRLAELDYPILVGPSRKSFLAHLTADEAAFATAAAVTAAILSGAHMVRVHDVKAMKVVVAVADEIARLAAAVANKIAEEEDAEWQAKKARGFGPKPLPPYMVEERVQPMRPPLAKVVKPVVVEPVVVEPVVVEPVAPVVPVIQVVASPAKAEEPVVPTDEIKPEAAVAEAVASASSVETSEPVNELPRSAADDLDDEDFDDEDSDEDELAGEELDIDDDDESADGDESEESADAEKSESAAPVPAPHSDTPAKAWGAKKPSDAPTDSTGDRQRPLREGFDPPRRAFGPPKPFGDRPPRRDFDGPRKVFSPRPPQGDRPRFDGPPRGDGDRPRFDGPPPRRDFDGPPPRRNFDGPPPRREGGYGAPQGDRPRFDGPPPRRDFGGPPPRRDGGGYGPPRGDGDRPPRRDYDGPPRRDFDGPPKRNFDGPPQRSFDGPPKRNFDGPPQRSFDGPPKRNFDGPPKRNFDGPPPRREGGGGYGPPRGDGPPRRDFGDSRPPRNFDGPPPRRDDGPSGGRPPYKPYGGPPKRDGGGPPFRGKPNDRPFRPSGPRPDGDRPGGGGPGGDRPYGSPSGKLFRKRP